MQPKFLLSKQIYSFIISFLSLIFCQHVFSQAVFTKSIYTKSITDFGANGTDTLDDTWAFIKAGKYISNLWDSTGKVITNGQSNYNKNSVRIKLTIPAGTFYVGKQISPTSCSPYNTTYSSIFSAGITGTATINLPDSNSKWYGLQLCNLDGVNEVEIAGTGVNSTKIRYNKNLYIGYYSCTGTEKTFNGTNPGSGYDNKYVSNIGSFIYATDCKNVSVHDFEIDGFNTPPPTNTPSPLYTNYGGSIGADGIQLGADGLLFINTKKITVKNINAHNMTFDGIQVKDHYYQGTSITPPVPDSLLTNLLIDSSSFNSNRRLGFAWVGGRGIAVSNSTFNNTGVPVFNWNGGKANGNPGAGIDIEPESFTLNGVKTLLYCMDANFTQCQFVNNMGYGVVNDFYVDTATPNALPRTININFANTLFRDVNGYAVGIKGRKFTFDSCKIWGAYVFGNSVGQSGDQTRFIKCDFADEDIPGVTTNIQRPNELINLDNYARRTLFSNCTFRALHDSIRLMFINTPSYAEVDFPMFSNCAFSYKNTHSQSYQGPDIVRRCAFDSVCTYTNNNPAKKHYMAARGLLFKGTTNSCSPASFTVKGLTKIQNDINGYPYPPVTMGRGTIGDTTSATGFFDFNIADSAVVDFYNSAKVNIGSNAVLRNKKKGMLILRGMGANTAAVGPTIINNNGKIILEDSSFTIFTDSITTYINSTATSEFYYHKNAKTVVNSYWTTSEPGFNITSRRLQSMQYTNTKIDGGNINVVNPALISSVNEALEFDGINDYVSIPFTSGVAPGGFDWSATNPFSLEIAFKRSDANRNDFLFSQANGLTVWFEGNGLNLTFYGNENFIQFIPDTKCHLMTITRALDGKIKVYLDGILSLTLNPVTGYLIDLFGRNYLVDPYNTIYLGRDFINPSYFYGWIGQVRLWSKELKQSDICRNYEWKLSYNPTGLWSDWDMTNSSGTTLTNRINPSATNNGIAINGPVWKSQNEVGECTNISNENIGFNNFRPIKSIKNNLVSISPSFLEKSIVVYPNPNSGEFELLFKPSKVQTRQIINIYSSDGKKVYTKSVNNESMFKIKLGRVESGFYILKLLSGNEIFVKKIIVTK